MDTLDEVHYFSSAIYAVMKPEFLEPIRAISNKYIKDVKCEGQCTVMTTDFSGEPEAKMFAEYVSQTGWNILKSQGYDMTRFITYFESMWTQEHNYLSEMDAHIHGAGVQLCAFFFLDVPEGGSVAVFHDPRPAKVIINLPEEDTTRITPASNQISMALKEGMIMFVPPYVAHQFTRNMNKEKAVRFVHMNLCVALDKTQPLVTEVI